MGRADTFWILLGRIISLHFQTLRDTSHSLAHGPSSISKASNISHLSDPSSGVTSLSDQNQETFSAFKGAHDYIYPTSTIFPTPVLSPGKSWRSPVGYSPRGRKELDTTEQLHFTSHTLPISRFESEKHFCCICSVNPFCHVNIYRFWKLGCSYL